MCEWREAEPVLESAKEGGGRLGTQIRPPRTGHHSTTARRRMFELSGLASTSCTVTGSKEIASTDVQDRLLREEKVPYLFQIEGFAGRELPRQRIRV